MKRFKHVSCLLLTLLSVAAVPANADTKEYVDLGLPSGTLWATCNIGATDSHAGGTFFAWGETATTNHYPLSKYSFSLSKYSYYTVDGDDVTAISKYNSTDGLTQLESADDAATVVWGSEWRIPTQTEWQELIEKCTWTNTYKADEYDGYTVTGPNGNSIFLAQDQGYYSSDDFYPGFGMYMSSTLVGDGNFGDIYGVKLNNGYYLMNTFFRSDGYSVRPISTTKAVRVTSITLSKSSTNLFPGETETLTATVLPDNAADNSITWSSSDETVATIENGVITAVAGGTATITATANDGSGVVATCNVTVSEPCPNNEIWYTASAKLTETTSTSTASGLHTKVFDKTMTSHTFENGKGVIKFSGDIGMIGDYAFYQCSGLISVTIPNYVTSIGQYSFSDCSSLTSVTIPDRVQTIYKYAFNGCKGLTSITINNRVTGIANFAFNGCSGLKEIHIYTEPNINMGTLDDTNPFTGVDINTCKLYVIASQMQNYQKHTFWSKFGQIVAESEFSGMLDNLHWHLDTNTGVLTLSGNGEMRESNFTGELHKEITLNPWRISINEIKKVEIKSGVTTIGKCAFCGCCNLKSITIPSTVTSIGQRAFLQCNNLSDISIPSSVQQIGSWAFESCSSLTSINLPNSLTSIENNVFMDCSRLTSITIPNSITSIGEQAFINACALTYVTINGTEVPTLVTQDALPTTCMIFVPNELIENYKTAENWSAHTQQFRPIDTQTEYDVTVEAQETMSSLHIAIGESNLANVVSLKVKGTINSYDIMIIKNKMPRLLHLDLSDASIVANSYEYYTGYCSHDDQLDRYAIPKQLYSLKLPKTLKVIGSYALEKCSQITNSELILPEGLQSVGANAFSESNWETIVLPESVTSIANNAFTGCSALRVLTLPFASKKLSELGVTADLKALTVTRGTIPDRFAYSKKENSNDIVYWSLEEVTFGEEVTQIGQYAFYECSKLQKYTSNDKLIHIGQYAFCNCLLSDVRINKDIQIDDMAFYTKYTGPNVYITHDCNAFIHKNAFRNARNIYLDDLETLFTITWTGVGSGYFGSGKFYVNDELVEDMVIPEGVTELTYPIFIGGKFKTLTLPSTLRTIGSGVFKNCSNLELLSLPFSLESIGASAFNGCTALKKVNLPTSLKTIGANAFQGCTAMTEVKLSSSIISIGDNAFNGCTALNDVYTYTIEPQVIDQNTFSTYSTATLHCPAASYYNYYYDTQWSQFLKLENFDEPYDYVYIAKDFDFYTENAGTIKGDPRMDIAATGGVTVKEDVMQHFSDIHITFDGEKSSSLIGGDNNLSADNVYMDITVNADHWYFFCFPFDVDLTKVQKEGSYVFRRYDGNLRAQANNGTGGWQDLTGTTLQAGTGYIFRTNTAGTLTLPVAAPNLNGEDKETTIEAYGSEGTTTTDNLNWNFTGNRYLSYYDINDLDYTAPIITWDGTAYVAYRPGDDDLVLTPFQAFFVQKPTNIDKVGFSKDGRTTYLKSQDNSANVKEQRFMAKKKKASRLDANRKLINLTLSDGANTDKTRIVFNDHQSMDYEMECDASKFLSTEKVPMLYSLDSKGTRYAINERPVEDGRVFLGFIAPADGEYTLAATRMDAGILIVDNEIGEVIDLAKGCYTFSASEGTDNERFAVILKGSPADGIESTEATVDENEGNAYDLSGRRIQKDSKGIRIQNGKKMLVK